MGLKGFPKTGVFFRDPHTKPPYSFGIYIGAPYSGKLPDGQVMS